MTRELHYGDIIELLEAARLGDESEDVSDWLERRSICVPAIVKYGQEIVEIAVQSADLADEKLLGLFLSGLTLGIAIGERHR